MLRGPPLVSPGAAACRNTRSRSDAYPNSSPPELAVGQHGKPFFVFVAAKPAAGRAVLFDKLAPAQRHYLFQQDFGNVRQVVAHLHQRQDIGDIRSGHAQLIDLLEHPQHIHLVFEVLGVHIRQAVPELFPQIRRARGTVQRSRVQQFVQQHRMPA